MYSSSRGREGSWRSKLEGGERFFLEFVLATWLSLVKKATARDSQKGLEKLGKRSSIKKTKDHWSSLSIQGAYSDSVSGSEGGLKQIGKHRGKALRLREPPLYILEHWKDSNLSCMWAGHGQSLVRHRELGPKDFNSQGTLGSWFRYDVHSLIMFTCMRPYTPVIMIQLHINNDGVSLIPLNKTLLVLGDLQVSMQNGHG
ncbi:hypothetical protein VNO77_22544 [Canavalia gladiata]|uniref:Uncharacterized protein n=1 Tax=Canavalia gladiata TaxID=3824 RepID=A0AAN9L617_CANGL